jgi:hypothetical protein
MTVHQLIELSILDAMALLDEDERLQFESAFRAAPPAIQAHVRREQTRLAQIESLLPQVEPPAGLRALVIEAVRAHIMASPATDDAMERLVLPISGTQQVSPIWRAGALGAMAAAILLGITTFIFKSQNEMMADRLQSGSLVDQLTVQFGPKFVRDVLFNPDTQRVILTAEQQEFKGEAAIFVNPEWTSAKFFCRAVATPEGRTYKLAVLDEDGRVVQVLSEITSSGELMPLDVKLKPGATGHIAMLASGKLPGQEIILARGSLGKGI